jgi:hypothetical protein
LRPFEHTVDRREQSRRKLQQVINGIDQGITFGVVEIGSKGIPMGLHRGAPRHRRCGEDSWVCLECRIQGERPATAKHRLINSCARETEAKSSG